MSMGPAAQKVTLIFLTDPDEHRKVKLFLLTRPHYIGFESRIFERSGEDTYKETWGPPKEGETLVNVHKHPMTVGKESK